MRPAWTRGSRIALGRDGFTAGFLRLITRGKLPECEGKGQRALRREKGGWQAREALAYIEAAGAGRRGVAAIEAGLRAMVLAKPGVEEASGVEAVQTTVITD